MDFLLFCLGLLGLWALFRSITDRSKLRSVEQELQALQDAALHQQQRFGGELQQVRSTLLTLLGSNEALRERLRALEAAPPLPALPAASPVLPPPEEPPRLDEVGAAPVAYTSAAEPPPVVAPVAEVGAILSAAAAAGLPLEDPAPPPPTGEPAVEAPAAGLPADIFSPPDPDRTPAPRLDPAPPMVEVPSLKTDKPFDYEQLLGVRGAAWLGAIALVVAGMLFAKYSIENDLIKPPLRVALLVLAGLGALVGAELGLRRRYEVTANALCGGGIAILYSATFAAHNLYDLIPLPSAFALLSLTTVVAALLSLRHDNVYIAVLGLFGGFVTPLALSTGQDRPFALFGYVLVLDLGFLVLAIRRGWHRLALLTLALTLVMEAGWANRFLVPAKLPIAVGIVSVFALLFMALPAWGQKLDGAKRRELLYGAATAGLLPFLLTALLAAQPEYGPRWPLLFGLVGILDLGLLALAVLRWPELATGALLATLVTHALWDEASLTPAGMPVAVGTALGFMLLFIAAPSVWRRVPGLLPAPEPGLPVVTSPPGSTAAPDGLQRAADVAALAPFVLAIGLAAYHDYATQTILLFGFVLLLCLTVLGLSLLRERPRLLVLGAALAATARLIWGASALHRSERLGQGVVTALLIAGLTSLGPHLLRWLVPSPRPEDVRRHESAALLAWLGLFAATGQLLGMELGPPPATMTVLVAALLLLWIDRTHPRPSGYLGGPASTEVWAFVPPLGAGALAALLQIWLGMLLSSGDRDPQTHEVRVAGSELLARVVIPLGACAVLHTIAAWRQARRPTPAEPPSSEDRAHAASLQASEMGAITAAVLGQLALILFAPFKAMADRPLLCFGVLVAYSVLLVVQSLRRGWGALWLVTLGAGAGLCAMWADANLVQGKGPGPAGGAMLLGWSGGLYLAHLVLPLLLLWLRPKLRTARSLYLTAGLAGPLLFSPMLDAWRAALGSRVVGLLPALLAAGAGAAFWAVRALPAAVDEETPPEVQARRRLWHQALFMLATLGFLAIAIPMQLHDEWIPIGWALLAAATWWIYRGVPHLTLKYLGLLLYLLVILALIPRDEVLHFHPRGLPVLNWLLYTYGLPVACFLVGAAGLRRVEAEHRAEFERAAVPQLATPLSAFAYYAGLLLLFTLINLEITDAFSTGEYAELWQKQGYAHDLTRSLAWALYAIGLLLIGVRQRSKVQRYFSLGFMLLTILKVFLYDLANVGGLYRALSFLGLAVSLSLVSVLYQRFVFPKAAKAAQPGNPSEGQPPARSGPP